MSEELYKAGKVVPISGSYILVGAGGEVIGFPRHFDKGDRFPAAPKKDQQYTFYSPSFERQERGKRYEGSPFHARSPVTGRTYPDLVAEIFEKFGRLAIPLLIIGSIGALVWFISDKFEQQRVAIGDAITGRFQTSTELINSTYKDISTVSEAQIKQLKEMYSVSKTLSDEAKALEERKRELEKETNDLNIIAEKLQSKVEGLNEEITEKSEEITKEKEIRSSETRSLIEKARVEENYRKIIEEDTELALSHRAKKIKDLRLSLRTLASTSQQLVSASKDGYVNCEVPQNANETYCSKFTETALLAQNVLNQIPETGANLVEAFFGNPSTDTADNLDLLIGEELSEDILKAFVAKTEYARSFSLPDLGINYYVAAQKVHKEYYENTISMQVNADKTITSVNAQKRIFCIRMIDQNNIYRNKFLIYTTPFLTRYLLYTRFEESAKLWSLGSHISTEFGGGETIEIRAGDGKELDILNLEDFEKSYSNEMIDLIELAGGLGNPKIAREVTRNASDIGTSLEKSFGRYMKWLNTKPGKDFLHFLNMAISGKKIEAKQLVAGSFDNDRIGHIAAVVLQPGFTVREVREAITESEKKSIEIVGENPDIPGGVYLSTYQWKLEVSPDDQWQIVSYNEALNEGVTKK